MSTRLLVCGDLALPEAAGAAWREDRIDAEAVGPLPEGLGPLQPGAPATVGAVWEALRRALAGEAGLAAHGSRVEVRAALSDHALHDLAAPLVAAFRLAGARGGRGELLLVVDAVPPLAGHRLVVPGGAAPVALGPQELAALARHPCVRALQAGRGGPRAPAGGPRGPRRASPPRAELAALPLADLDDALRIRAIAARLDEDPVAAFAALGPALADAVPDTPLLHATLVALGNRGPRRTDGRSPLLREPRWADWLATVLSDVRVAPAHREHALAALASTGEARWIGPVLEHEGVADPIALATALLALGDPAFDAARARLPPQRWAEVDAWRARLGPPRRRR